MKKTILIAGSIVLVLTACHTTTKVSADKTNTETTGAPTSNVYTPTQDEMETARNKFADVSIEQLQEGHKIYYGPCTKCHGTKNTSGFSEEKIKSVVERMAPKARLSDSQKEAVLRYMVTTIK